MGKPIKTDKREGVFKGLTKGGALQLESADGSIVDINAGDVYFPAVN